MRFKTILALSLTFLVVAPLVFFLEVLIINVNPLHTARSIIGVYTLFYTLALGELYVIKHFRRVKPGALTGVYMASKGIRFFVTIALIVFYGILKGPEFIAFTFNVFICFIVTLVLTTVLHVKEENKNNPFS